MESPQLPSKQPFRACNACKRRKVKCSGGAVCSRCSRANLHCVYGSVHPAALSRRSIVRGKVIESYRQSLAQEETSNDGGKTCTTLSQTSQTDETNKAGASRFTTEFFLSFVEDYCNYTLPTVPIVGEAEFRSAIEAMHHSTQDRSLVYSLTAQTLNLTRTLGRGVPINGDDATILYEMALQNRQPVFFRHQITVKSVMVPLLVSIGMFATGRDVDMGYYYNREAITGVQILRVDDPEHQNSFDPGERAQRERLHWLLFIHDRFHALCSYRPAVMSLLPNIPEDNPSIPPGVTEYFNQLIRVFRVVDDDFIRNWIDKTRPDLTLRWIENKQSELGNDSNTWSAGFETLSDMQQVDLIVTRYWLRTLLWEMALHKSILRSDVQNPNHDFLSLAFPIRLSHQLQHCLSTKPREAVEIHGTGILDKIFEITCTVADLLRYVVPNTCPAEVQSAHVDCFLFLYSFLLKMSKFYHVERALLKAKLHAVQAVFPFVLDGKDRSDSWSSSSTPGGLSERL